MAISARPTLFDYDVAPGLPVLGHPGMEPVTFMNGPWPPGFAPPAFFEVGSIVSANNQRPAQPPDMVVQTLPLIGSGLNDPVQQDIRFRYVKGTSVPESWYWRTNTQLDSDMMTYADGVRKNDSFNPYAPNILHERWLEYQTMKKNLKAKENVLQQKRELLGEEKYPDAVLVRELAELRATLDIDRQRLVNFVQQYQVPEMEPSKYVEKNQQGMQGGQEIKSKQYGLGPFRATYQIERPGEKSNAFAYNPGTGAMERMGRERRRRHPLLPGAPPRPPGGGGGAPGGEPAGGPYVGAPGGAVIA